jgi:probable selenium-dependent hydroxylase accessory protein YqeC
VSGRLLDLFGLQSGGVAAVAGAGGKTTLVYALAAQARAAGLRVLVTTTTHMGTLPEEVTGPVFVEAEGAAGEPLERALAEHGRATLLGRRVRPDKLEGVPPQRVDALSGLADLVLVEADGARGRSLKAPADHEPVVPAATTLLIVVAALDALGAPFDEERVHRLERVIEVTGGGAAIDEAAVAACLLHPSGYPQRRPPSARLAAFLNKAEGAEREAAAARVAARLSPAYSLVVAGSARAGTGRRWMYEP